MNNIKIEKQAFNFVEAKDEVEQYYNFLNIENNNHILNPGFKSSQVNINSFIRFKQTLGNNKNPEYYFNLHPLKQPNSRKNNNINNFHLIGLDIERTEKTGKETLLDLDKVRTIIYSDIINKYKLTNYMIVFSGNGYHLYIMLNNKYYDKDETNINLNKLYGSLITQLSKSINNFIKITDRKDLASILRIPTTYNTKADRVVKIIDFKNESPNNKFQTEIDLFYNNFITIKPAETKSVIYQNKDDIFFTSILENKKDWDKWIPEFEKLSERNNHFFKNLAIFIVQNPKLKDKSIEFFNKWRPERIPEYKGWLDKAKNMSIAYGEIKNWLNLPSNKDILPNWQNLIDQQLSFLNKDIGYNYEINNKTVRIVEYYTKKDDILKKNILEFDFFYKINAVIFNLQGNKVQKIFYKVKTRDKTKNIYLIEQQFLIERLQELIKSNISNNNIILEVKDFILESDLLDNLLIENKQYTTHYYFNITEQKFLVPNFEEIKENNNIIKCDLIQIINKPNGNEYFESFLNIKDEQYIKFFKSNYNKNKVLRCLELLKKLPRCDQEFFNYKLAFSYSIASVLNNLFSETLILGAKETVGTGKSVLLTMTIGNLWRTSNTLDNSFYSREYNNNVPLKPLLPTTFPLYNDELQDKITSTCKAILKKKCFSSNFPYTEGKGNGMDTINYPSPYQHTFSGNNLQIKTLSDIVDKTIFINFSEIKKLQIKKELLNKLSNSEINELNDINYGKPLIYHLGEYFRDQIYSINHISEIKKLKEKLQPKSRIENQFLFIKYGEYLFNKLTNGLYNETQITKERFISVLKTANDNMYTEKDDIVETIHDMFIYIENISGISIKNFIFDMKNENINITDKHNLLYKNLSNAGVYIKIINNGENISFLLQNEFKLRLNKRYKQINHYGINLKHLMNIYDIFCESAKNKNLIINEYKKTNGIIIISEEKDGSITSVYKKETIQKMGIQIDYKIIYKEDN